MPLNLASIQLARPQNTIHYFATIGSTMTEGTRLAQAGAAHGTVVLAEEQTSGMGRLGRTWISEKEAGLYSSTLLRLQLAPAQLPIASLLLALATAEAMERSAGCKCDLRWPNDVLVDERKVAGILPHLVSSCIVAGIGINVNQQSFDPNLRTPATSLALATGAPVSREAVLIELLEAIDRNCQMLADTGPQAIRDAFAQRSSYAQNREVVLEDTGVRGWTAGLDHHGFLLLRTSSGKLERIASGGVRPVV